MQKQKVENDIIQIGIDEDFVHENTDLGYCDDDIVVISSLENLPEKINRYYLCDNVIVLCMEGRVEFQINGNDNFLEENYILISHANVFLGKLKFSGDFKCLAILMSDRLLSATLKTKISIWNNALYVNNVNILKAKDIYFKYEASLEHSLNAILSDRNSAFYREKLLAFLSVFMLVICEMLLQQAPPNNVDAVKSGNVIFERFITLLASEEVKFRKVEYYASQLCITPKYLSLVCNSVTGKGPKKWITEYVVKDVEFYLKNTVSSCKEISEKLGFPNLSFFGKYCRKHFGCSPLNFRRKK
ncbi:MAG: helix-turn-helix domain-containing protein [Bacteroidales bacterium]|nr:helix-turn-helix domain-containing protein [Bacteroidales bacterium]